jgi:hypothetical protein
VGINAEEGFAHSDKDGEVESGIRGQLPKLDPVGKEEATKKFVGWKGKPMMHKGNEHDGKTLWRLWERNRTWMRKVRLSRRNKPHRPHLVLFTFGDGGCGPVEASSWCACGSTGASNTLLPAHGCWESCGRRGNSEENTKEEDEQYGGVKSENVRFPLFITRID